MESSSFLVFFFSQCSISANCLSVSSPSNTEFWTRFRYLRRKLHIFETRSTDTSYTTMTNILPPDRERLVFLDPHHMLSQLDALKIDQPPVGYIPAEVPVLDGSLKLLIEFRKEKPPPLVVEKTRPEFRDKILRRDHILVDQFEDDPVHEKRFEDLG